MDDFRQVIDLDQATGDDTLRLARTAAEAIRGLNWLTRCEAGLGQPSIAYDTIGALAQAASRLPQALSQVTRWLDQAWPPGGSATTSARTPPRPPAPPRSSSATRACPPLPWPATWMPPSSSSPSSTARPAAAPGRNSHDR